MLLRKLFGLQRGLRLDIVFSYNSPVWHPNYFYRRVSVCKEVIDSIIEPGTQPLIFGERQVGKTSVIIYCLLNIKTQFQRVQCFEDMEKQEFIRETLHTLQKFRLDQVITKQETQGELQGASSLLMAKVAGTATRKKTREETISYWIREPTISDLVRAISSSNATLFIDDIERLRDEQVIKCFGNLAKAVSDKKLDSSYSQIVFSIAASERSQIPDCLRSLGNRIRLVRVPRMTGDEISGLIKHGLILSFLKLNDSVIKEIVEVSEGIPSKAKLLCLEAGRAVADSAGIKNQRLLGDEPVMDLAWFRNDVIPKLARQGML